MSKTLFVSIRPLFAGRILTGQKTVELRRSRPAVSQGDLLLLYASSPTRALVAVTLVACVTSAKVDQLWGEIQSKAGITFSEFETYFKGAQSGSAIHMTALQEFSRPVSLRRLREIWPGFRPPQSFRYITRDQLQMLNEYENLGWQTRESEWIPERASHWTSVAASSITSAFSNRGLPQSPFGQRLSEQSL